MKKVLLIGLVLIALVIVAVLVVPPFIDMGAHKARFLPLVEEALQRKVDVGEVRLRILPRPSVGISALNVADHPGFSNEPFFTARHIKLQLKFWPLLKGQLQVDEFILEKPIVNLLQHSDGTFNFAAMAKKKGMVKDKESPPKIQQPVKFSQLIPSRVGIEGGEVTFQTKGEKPLKIRGIDISLKDFSPDRPFPYRAALNLPGLRPIALEGILSYQESRAALNLRENHLRVLEMDFAVNGTVSDLTGFPQVNLTVANDAFETRPIFQLLSAAGLMPKGLEISGSLGLQAALTGPTTSLVSAFNAQFKGLKISDSRAFTGTLVGEILLTLPLGGEAPLTQTLSGNGKLAAKDGALTNVDLISKIQRLTGLVGIPPEQSRGATAFKTLEMEFALGSGIAHVKRLFMASPLMEALGSGKMTLASASLDLGIEASLAPDVSARAGGGNVATFFKDGQGRIVVPLKVTGPINEPSVSLDSDKVIQRGVGQLLERFFRRR